MLSKSGGFAALLDRSVVTQCPLCDTDNPDLDNHGFCSNCGALFREKIVWRLNVVKAAITLGVLLTATGAVLALRYDLRWTGIALFLGGLAPLAFGIAANRQLAGFLLEALGRRTAKETQRCLRTTDRVALGLLIYFAAAFVGCIPYYLYIERPRQRLREYQARFADAVDEYVALVSEEAEPAGAAPYLAGKAVVVEKTASGGQVSEVHLALSPEVRAERPDEVGTVVVVAWSDFRKGPYPGTQQAGYFIDGDMRVVNLATRTLLARESFRGGDPPDYAPRDGSDGRGPKPIAKIAGYVNGLKPGAPPVQPPASEETPASTPAEEPATGGEASPKPEPKSKK